MDRSSIPEPTGAFADRPPDEILERQAQAYVESYLRRKSEALR